MSIFKQFIHKFVLLTLCVVVLCAVIVLYDYFMFKVECVESAPQRAQHVIHDVNMLCLFHIHLTVRSYL